VQIALRTEVEVDGATFVFGAADNTQQRAVDAYYYTLVMACMESLGPLREVLSISEEAPNSEVAEAFAAKNPAEQASLFKEAGIDFSSVQLPDDTVAAFAAFFVEGLRDWRGVKDEAGKEVPCNGETVRDFPTSQKVAVASAYLGEYESLLEKKGNGNGPPTDSMAHESTSTETPPAN